MSSAREEILQGIRTALAATPVPEEPRLELRQPASGRAAPSSLFIDRVREYHAAARWVPREAELPPAIEAVCAEHGARDVAGPLDLPKSWLPPSIAGISERNLSPNDLDAVGAAVTGCTLGIADTGTLVLDGGFAQGRRTLTLLPDLHVCIVKTEQIVGSLAEAISILAPAARAHRPLTFVSGRPRPRI